ncbi:MAG: 4Fe-4S binding protein [Syntrophobacteraceae bacterium]
MANMRKIVEIDEQLCDGCGLCALACAEGALEIKDGKARIISDSYCDGLGACLSGCPTGAVRIIEREADEFDPEAVEEYLAAKGEAAREGTPPAAHTTHSAAHTTHSAAHITHPAAHITHPAAHTTHSAGRTHAVEAQEAPREHKEFSMACGCPSSRVETFPVDPRPEKARGPGPFAESESQLAHWPIQIRLVPPTAPFLKRAHLLVVADCAPVAYPDFHKNFVKGKAVLMGCPKLDNKEEYVSKFAEIFRTAEIRGVTVIDMEVPCCSAMPMIVQKAMKEAGKDIPLEEVVIGVRGNIVKKGRNAA